MLFFPALVLVLTAAMLVVAILRPPNRPAAVAGLYLLGYANIVLAGQIANSFWAMNRLWVWIALHSIFLAAAWLAWQKAGRPSLVAPWKDQEGRFLPAGWRTSLPRWPELWLLGLGGGLAFLLSAVLIWVVPPNNNDSLATHMSRVGYWMQRGSFFPWPTTRIWQVSYPVNMQLQMFWTALFFGSDRIVESVQWLGALAAVVVVFGLARLLGASRPQALFAALVWATFPEIILESTTTQNDLVAGTLFSAMVYLLFLGLKTRNTGALMLSGLALALGLGTKQTLFFLLPGLALVLLLLLWWGGRQTARMLLVWGWSGLAAFLLVGAYMFVVNQISFGHPMGPETAVSAQTGGQTSQSLRENLAFNVFRLMYQAVDPTGLPDPLTGYAFKAKALVVGKLAEWVGYPVEEPVAVAPGHKFVLRERYVLQEDAAWYGPLFTFLVLPALVYQLWVGLRTKDALRVSIFIFALTFLILDAALRPGWDPFQGRYFIPVVILSTPLIAFIFRPGRPALPARWLIVLLALIITQQTFLYNSGKPLNGESTVWTMNQTQLKTLQSFYMREPVMMVEKYVPADTTLGLVTYGVFLEYPFFREDFSRRLVQIEPPERIQDLEWLRGQGVEYIAILMSEAVPAAAVPDELVPVAGAGNWTLFTWRISNSP